STNSVSPGNEVTGRPRLCPARPRIETTDRATTISSASPPAQAISTARPRARRSTVWYIITPLTGPAGLRNVGRPGPTTGAGGAVQWLHGQFGDQGAGAIDQCPAVDPLGLHLGHPA